MEIGRGAQYKVVDIGGGRVRKFPLTVEESHAVVASWYPPGKAPESELAIDYISATVTTAKVIETLLQTHPDLAYAFGNPIFEGKGVYTQDKVRTLGDVLQQSTAAQGKKLLAAYIDAIHTHWRHGISERTFNFTVNNGVDAQGRVILLDFGELRSDKQKVIAAIETKRWLTGYSYRQHMPEALRDFYARRIEQKLTVGLLDSIWGAEQAGRRP